MDTWLANARLADSTRAMREHIIDRDILPVFQDPLLTEIQAEDLRALCNKVKERGAPATAVQIRDIVKQVYVYAIAHGEKVDNPADSVGAASIATFVPKDRAGLQPGPDREVLGARGLAFVALYLQQSRIRRAAAPHAASVGQHGRCLDRRADLRAEAYAGECGGTDAARDR